MAKLVLVMPISTVASESAFSTGGRVIDESRSSLTHVTAEALIYAQDWIWDTPIDILFKKYDDFIHGRDAREVGANRNRNWGVVKGVAWMRIYLNFKDELGIGEEIYVDVD
ncbi:uncharacterized protein LOC111897278 [Lactuca sativa]|uniref:uncharacterized protein LOC111897278 n=1 Tax=Lactuca sativa TaxID=4236 RepID=UPI000CD8CBD4|nr:uncharacterized protein LOC111897278 [Lactuca sativa]